MPKVDVGIGDEFPAKEVKDEAEDPVEVHHHHHYYRRRWRRPGGFLRVILWIMLLSLVARIYDWLTNPYSRWGWRHGGAWRDGVSQGSWGPPGLAGPYEEIGGMAVGLVLIVGILWFLGTRRPSDGER